jgi:hypothetical protein
LQAARHQQDAHPTSILSPGEEKPGLTIAHPPATQPAMTHLRIALEWFLNPDHLPLLSARERNSSFW